MASASLGISVQPDLFLGCFQVGARFHPAAGARPRLGNRVRRISGGDPGPALDRESELNSGVRSSQETPAKVSSALKTRQNQDGPFNTGATSMLRLIPHPAAKS